MALIILTYFWGLWQKILMVGGTIGRKIHPRPEITFITSREATTEARLEESRHCVLSTINYLRSMENVRMTALL